jgi:hypothetical protein
MIDSRFTSRVGAGNEKTSHFLRLLWAGVRPCCATAFADRVALANHLRCAERVATLLLALWPAQIRHIF